MVSTQCSILLLLLLSVVVNVRVAVVLGSSEISHSHSALPPNDAAFIPLPLTHPSSSVDRFYVGQRQQLIGSSSSSSPSSGSSAQSNSINKDKNNNNESEGDVDAVWRYLNHDQVHDEQNNSKPLNPHCTVYQALAKIICRQLEFKSELPFHETYFDTIQHGVFLNTSSRTQIKLLDLKALFPNLVSLSITQSTTTDSGSSETTYGHNHNNLLNEIFLLQDEAEYHQSQQTPPVHTNGNGNGNGNGVGNDEILLEGARVNKPGGGPLNTQKATLQQQQSLYHPSSSSGKKKKPLIIWPSVKILNLSNNNVDESGDGGDEDPVLYSSSSSSSSSSYRRNSHDEYNSISLSKILNVFPNLQQLELKGNRITTLKNITRQNQLKFIDISDNPLDCTSEEIKWLESSNITLLNLENTLCDRPPHQNKPKPILQTIHLLKKVQEECRVNCSCEIDYIWEQEKVIHSKTSVNCSSRNFSDFPDPDKLPHPTDTLYLNNNHIRSFTKFVYDTRYTALNLMNLYVDNNQISSLNELEQSDWIYNFQILSLRKNNLTEVHVHLLENIIRLNKWVYQIDLSDNNWNCECRTVSTFKVWLLQHYKFVRNIGNVKCGRTGREIRYLRNEDWCEIEETKPMIEFLDILNIFMGLLILLIIGKVMYDYWNLSRHGKVPWLVGKIW